MNTRSKHPALFWASLGSYDQALPWAQFSQPGSPATLRWLLCWISSWQPAPKVFTSSYFVLTRKPTFGWLVCADSPLASPGALRVNSTPDPNSAPWDSCAACCLHPQALSQTGRQVSFMILIPAWWSWCDQHTLVPQNSLGRHHCL